MGKTNKRQLGVVGILIVATCAAMAYTAKSDTPNTPNTPNTPPAVPATIQTKSGILTLSGNLTQDKIFGGGEGRVSMGLAVAADDIPNVNGKKDRHVDMVVVLDRSGSMNGQKLRDARESVSKLLANLTGKDRFSLIAYSDSVVRYSQLIPVTPANRNKLEQNVEALSCGGGTNLGAGLQEGIRVISESERTGNVSKVILISDGLANQGITDPSALSEMASAAVRHEFSISTVGVGVDFNERLMTAIADSGTGNYHFLENPEAFARVFNKELLNGRLVAAQAVQISIPLADGMTLADASGYPIKVVDNRAVFHIGDLMSGQTRKFFVTFGIPAEEGGEYRIEGVTAKYTHDGRAHTARLPEPFVIACVADKKEAVASIDKNVWEQQVLRQDFNKLKEEVALDISQGKKRKALDRIREYKADNESLNSVVQSERVTENLEKDLGALQEKVEDSFSGSPSEIRSKQKLNAKELQFEGYWKMRN